MATNSSNQSSVEEISGNEDLLIEILSRIPVKPLIRFKFVSKQWFNLISGGRFSFYYSRRNPNHTCTALFFQHSLSTSNLSSHFDFISLDGTARCADPPFLLRLNSACLNILQSCNGLLLCRSISQCGDSNLAYYICNPTINRIAQLRCPNTSKLGDQSVVALNLAFDPSKSSDYKVVCVCKVDQFDNSYWIDVYSPLIGQWRRSVDFFTPPFDVEFERGVYWNGNIHWLSHTETTVFFDVESECMKSLALPPSLEGAYIGRFRYFGESHGHLHLIEIRTNCVADFDVLEMDADYVNWFVKYRVNLDVLGCEFHEMFLDGNDRFGRRFRFYAFSILSVVRGEEEEDSTLILSIPGKVLSFNFRTKITRSLCNVVDQSDKWLPFKGYNAYQYIPSLYCI
ncbi:hypothetical protein Nepgr_013132 [Nepenthes gracilis]|uniref:F-box domain-containing protein n=1 Tax=Nepenthes gracilis TaxID=150966 RepID=A0AAD3SIX9_NEPGR|nr:hypothetical protein Nepgr_013132 [Nepenthes gracilis]